jgi:hypothetical protein
MRRILFGINPGVENEGFFAYEVGKVGDLWKGAGCVLVWNRLEDYVSIAERWDRSRNCGG